MEEWRFEPAHDFGLSAEQRRLSLRREVGLESAISCFLWRSITRLYLAIAHRLRIRGRENLPTRPPFILVANHASHLDAIIKNGGRVGKFSDRKSTRLNSSHVAISYAVFCLKKKKTTAHPARQL